MKQTILYRGSISFDRRPNNFLNDSINSIREWFNGEIIISTWKGQEKYITDTSKIDKIILSDDPGSGPVQSFKRQVVSFLNGVNVCDDDSIIVVVRPDMIFTKNIFNTLSNDALNNGKYSIFKNNRIIIGNMMTISPDSNEPNKTFRIGDWIHIGNKKDLKKWANIIDIIDNNDYSNVGGTEQAWAFSAIKKYLYPSKNIDEISKLDDHYWEFLINNFKVLNSISTLGVINKNWDFQPEFHHLYITEEDYNKKFKELYKI